MLGLVCIGAGASVIGASIPTAVDSSPLRDKAACLQRDLLDKHWLDGLYVGIVPAAPPGTRLAHAVDQPGNVIHSGVWPRRYLAGVGYQCAVTRDPWARRLLPERGRPKLDRAQTVAGE